MVIEEWRHVARAMAAHDIRPQFGPGGEIDDYWADHLFGPRAKQFLAAFDAVTEYRAVKIVGDGVAVGPSHTPVIGPLGQVKGDAEIERVARRMARHAARERGFPTSTIEEKVDEAWLQYREAAIAVLNQIRSEDA